MGQLGEQLVAQWLRSQGWQILHERWHSRWGELDLIAQQPTPIPAGQTPIALIEVKTRTAGNWDADGLLAITPKKQAKLWQTAECFLATYPQWADCPCRFDVALVHCQTIPGQGDLGRERGAIETAFQNQRIQLGQPIEVLGYRLILKDYIPDAFS